ncbi:hypothetical protein ACTA71_004724 [Dictyostelium dimigraforme]
MKSLSILILCFFYLIKLNNSTTVLFDTYTWSGPVNNYSIVLTGTGFATEDNFVNINGISTICSRPIINSDGINVLTCPPSAVNSNVKEGGALQIFIKTDLFGGTPNSNTQNWRLFKLISVTLTNVITAGGPVTLGGQYSTTDSSIVTVKIDGGSPCTIQSLTTSQIQFISPSKSAIGLYPFVLIIGGFQYNANINYVYGTPPTLDNKYSWKSYNGKTVLQLSGKYFSPNSNNIINVNGVDYSASNADASFGSQTSIYLLDDTVTNSIADGGTFQVFVKCGGQSTDTKTFQLIKLSISKTTSLYDIGGIATFEGTFGNGASSLIKAFTIGTSNPTLKSLTTTSISFQYSTLNAGTYSMVLNMGGCEITTSVIYSTTPSPIINKYKWPSGNQLVLYGQWFGYYVSNIISVNNGNGITVTSAVVSSGFDTLSLSPTITPSIGDLFTVKIQVGSRSTTANFVYIQSVSMTTQLLNTTGGIVTFTGSFTVSNTAVITLTIDGSQCNIMSVSPTQLTFKYPVKTLGQYALLMYIGGFEYSTTVQYTNPPNPTILPTYKWGTDGGLYFTGCAFGYVNPNTILINAIGYSATLAVGSDVPGYDDITFSNAQLSLSLFQDDQLFTARVSTGGLFSNIVTLTFIKKIIMNVKDIYSVDGFGGSTFTTFTGTYGTSNKSIVSLSIGEVDCIVNSIVPTSIGFSYNSNLKLGSNDVLINIGGLDYKTLINVISPPKPTLFNSYYWSSNDILVLKGSTFSYKSSNKININGIDYNSLVSTSNNGNDEITFINNSATSALSIGQPFTVYVNNGVEDSNSVTFINIKSISMDIHEIYNVDGLGGGLYTNFTGSYGTNNISTSSLYIGDVECIINSIQPNSMEFSHDSNLQLGVNNIFINIGGFEYTTTINVISPPKPILLNSYYWSSDNFLVLRGSTFNYKSTNKVNINGVDFNSLVATLNNGNDEITFNDNSSISSLTVGQQFTVYINNGAQDSNSITFVFMKSISITTQNLNNTGGEVTFSGDYYVSDATFVSLLIDNSAVQITNITLNSISFLYPSKTNGEYNLLIRIGGFEYSTKVQYVTKPTPSPSQTTNVQTTGVETTNAQTTGTQTTNVQTTGVETTNAQTTGAQTTNVQTTGVETTNAQTTGAQTTDAQTTNTQTTGTQTTGTQTTGTQTTNAQTTGTQTSKPESPSDEDVLSISLKLQISFILQAIFLLLLL